MLRLPDGTELRSCAKDITGQKFGRLQAIIPIGIKRRGLIWLCRCECGVQKGVSSRSLLYGDIVSCGCYKNEAASLRFRTHGRSYSRIKFVWSAMKNRCHNPHTLSYPRYGGRGIKVCARWQEFKHFFADMGDAPTGMTLERINNNGDYEPTNCRWATPKEQARNTRNNKTLTFCGKTQCLSAWAEELRVPVATLQSRIRSGWTTERTLSTATQTKEIQ